MKVLMVGQSNGTNSTSLALRYLHDCGCDCSFADSAEALPLALKGGPFDLVLSSRNVEGRSMSGLGGLFWGSRASLYYSLGTEDAWWLPVLERGRTCFGAPALNTKEFIAVLSGFVGERAIGGSAEGRSRNSLWNKERTNLWTVSEPLTAPL